MKNKIVAVFDREEGYARRFTQVFNSKNRMGFLAELFTSVDSLWNYSSQQEIEILLIGDSLMEERLRQCAAMIVIISEGTQVAELDSYEVVYKYQSSELIIQKVLETYGQRGRNAEKLCKPDMKLFGVYAPQERGLTTAFAWNLAKYFAENKSVLYINLTAFSGKRELYESGKDLADIMYYVHHGFDNLIYLAGSAVCAVDGIDCMPVMKSPGDLVQVQGEDWMTLLQVMMSQSHYEVLILQVEECVQQFYKLLEICTRVYFPMAATQDSAKWEVCGQYFERVGAIEVWKQAKRLTLDKHAWRTDMRSIIDV